MSSNIKHSRDIAFRGICNGYQKSIERITQQYCNVLISEGRYSDVNSDSFFVYMCEYLKARGHLYGYWWITISLPHTNPEDEDFIPMTCKELHNFNHKLIKCVETISKYKKFLGEMWFTLEQKSDNSVWYGPHVHILAQDLGVKKSQVVQRVHNAIKRKNYWPDAPLSSVHVRYGNYETHMKYLKGDKEKSKMSNVMQNIDYRRACACDRGNCEYIPYEYSAAKLGVDPDLLAQLRGDDTKDADCRTLSYKNPALKPSTYINNTANIELANDKIL